MRKQQQTVTRRKRRRSSSRYRCEQPLALEERYRTILRFGPYRGQLLCRSPMEYLKSLVDAPGIDPKLKRMAAELIELPRDPLRQPES
jgi:hypothetical protein